MTAYLDTSALVKLLIDEQGSAELFAALKDQVLASCRITYAEARSALARREREDIGRDLPKPQAWLEARARLTLDWPQFLVLEVDQALVETAAEFSDVFRLRGYDAVQLAAGHAVRAATDDAVTFFSFDRRLNRAAHVLGLTLPAGAPR